MQNQIDTLRQLNYELIKNLGLFRQRAGLSFGQRHTLYHINAHQGLSIQELAELLQVDHSTMSRNVKKLMQADLVETFQDDADKRRKMIALSAVGRQVLDEATESINLTISNALQSLDEDEINEMPILSDLFGVWFAGCAKVRCHKGGSACGMEDIEM